jgi:hypothetical protein
MSRLPSIALAAALLSGMAAAPAAAQPPPLPDGVVARVGEEPISERQFRHWLGIGIRGAGSPVDPPGFERCIAAERQTPGEPPSDAELLARCRKRYRALRTSTMLFLLHGVWVRQETAERGLGVSRAQVRRAFARQKRQAFPTESAFREFLRSSGLREADILKRVEFDLLQRRLTRAATEDVPEVTRRDVDRYYAGHRRQFRGVPPARARRTIRTQLKARRQQRALARFIGGFRARYRADTVCADGYVIGACSNAP